MAAKAQLLRETACPGTYRNLPGDRRSRIQRELKTKKKKKGTLQIRAYSRNMDQAVLKPSLGSTARTSRLVSVRRKRWEFDGGEGKTEYEWYAHTSTKTARRLSLLGRPFC